MGMGNSGRDVRLHSAHFATHSSIPFGNLGHQTRSLLADFPGCPLYPRSRTRFLRAVGMTIDPARVRIPWLNLSSSLAFGNEPCLGNGHELFVALISSSVIGPIWQMLCSRMQISPGTIILLSHSGFCGTRREGGSAMLSLPWIHSTSKL
jgi:hypothetical protein